MAGGKAGLDGALELAGQALILSPVVAFPAVALASGAGVLAAWLLFVPR